ncbi:MAG: deoxyribodipyrimidine photolyase [Hydrogenophilales bacterium 16-64-46]|nr:MAG: deoxyribodipyrimidine photolyase [Hydrogenophilales bacterium 12-64-13]OYZ05278.1 MAG: deoxyribodipyrimidine photolyase [Hydrogenophilales bacterium 16-64-46]OZA37092.1 MAG: deoxyribodipyrimidine photolyase [Hydrogenophilales bacterium 17-64-34]HQS99427.1 deoxyribodipyrimidine photo-lyase [Thiobacillus sp.]
MPEYSRALVWFRRDLRDFDHAALYHALKSARQVVCVFVFDREILDALPNRADRRVEFIQASVTQLQQALQARGGGLVVVHDSAREAIPRLAAELDVEAVYCNHDDDPAAIARDAAVEAALSAEGIAFHHGKDCTIFERDEVLTAAGTPFSVFTPYKNAWLKKLAPFYLTAYPVGRYWDRLAAESTRVPALAAMGFTQTNLTALKLPVGMSGGAQLFADFLDRIGQYKDARDFPAIKGPSYLSVHLRFGTVSVRQLAATAYGLGGRGAETWLSELVWRDFYHQILWHRPEVAAGRAFKPQFDTLPWPNPPGYFEAWCEARTGYPLVDAAMRQLNQTGYMHNRLRMVAASFLTKDLLVDWRLGERYFADTLIDFDLAANSGGWQWAASVGCDAQPWFRIFNPVTQSEKFDPQGKFIRRYLPELAAVPDKFLHAPWTLPAPEQARLGVVIGRDYPAPLVDHAVQRVQALALFKSTSGDGLTDSAAGAD